MLAKFSEGKRLNLEHTDLWKSMILLVFCRTGSIEDTHKELSALLDLSTTSAERVQLSRKRKKREQNGKQASSDIGKERRHAAKITSLIRMGKEDSKKVHRSEKLPTTKSTKSKVKICTKCKHHGHPTQECPVVKLKCKSKKKELMDWNALLPRPKSKRANGYTAKINW